MPPTRHLREDDGVPDLVGREIIGLHCGVHVPSPCVNDEEVKPHRGMWKEEIGLNCQTRKEELAAVASEGMELTAVTLR